MSNTILHIIHEDHSADILASQVSAIIRLPSTPADSICQAFPACTKVEYCGTSIIFLIDIEEHDALVSAWRAAVA